MRKIASVGGTSERSVVIVPHVLNRGRRTQVRQNGLARLIILGVLVGIFCIPRSQALAIELSVHNELRPDEPNPMLVVEEARSVESPRTRFRVTIYPGKTVKITKGNLKIMRIVRPFNRHKLKYEIVCPNETEGEGVVTLLQIHENELPGGCYVDRTGHWSRRTGLKWTDVENKDEEEKAH